MASITLRTDDLTGETLPDNTPTTTITVSDPRFELSVEIDLSDTSVKTLQKALDKIVAKARPVTPPRTGTLGADATEAKAARLWAIDQRPELRVSERGAVPKAAIVAYRAHLANVTDNNTDSN